MGLDLENWYGGSYSSDDTPAAPTAVADGGEPYALSPWPMALTRGVVLGDALVMGRFLPLHRGHAHLVSRAAEHVAGKVHVVVAARQGDLFSAIERVLAARAVIPAASVGSVLAAHDVGRPGEPDGDAFWEPWLKWLRAQRNLARCKVLVSGAPGAQRFAELAGLDFLLVDRREVPLSGTAVRADPWAHWDDIAPQLRGAFAHGVAIVGPEGAGKTTLGQQLRAHFNTSLAREYVETWCRAMAVAAPAPTDFPALTSGTSDAWFAAKRRARKFFFADTELLTLTLWERRLFGKESPRTLLRPQLTLLLDDAPWGGPKDRDEPAARAQWVADFKRELEARGWPYVFISGPREGRFELAVRAVSALRWSP